MSEPSPNEGHPGYFGATFAERKAARLAAEGKPAKAEPKQVDAETDEVEDKAIKAAATKKRAPRKAAKS